MFLTVSAIRKNLQLRLEISKVLYPLKMFTTLTFIRTTIIFSRFRKSGPRFFPCFLVSNNKLPVEQKKISKYKRIKKIRITKI